MKVRVWMVAVMAVAAIGTAKADPRGAVIDSLAQCTYLTDAAARLACFDRDTPALRAAAKAPAPVTPPPAETAPPPRDDGGSILSSLNPFGGDDHGAQGGQGLPLTMAVTDFNVPPNGQFTVTLKNGQVWQAVHGYSKPPPFRTGAPNTVHISRGFIGGYNLTLSGRGTLYKVERQR